MAHNTLMILNQVIATIWKNCQIWDVNDGVRLRRKAMQLKQIQAIKESIPGLNDDLGIKMFFIEMFSPTREVRLSAWMIRSYSYVYEKYRGGGTQGYSQGVKWWKYISHGDLSLFCCPPSCAAWCFRS